MHRYSSKTLLVLGADPGRAEGAGKGRLDRCPSVCGCCYSMGVGKLLNRQPILMNGKKERGSELT